jgi:hypothetical protein
MNSIRGDGARLRPFSYGLNLFRSRHAKRLRAAELLHQDCRRELLFAIECRVHACDDGLLDLGSKKPFARSIGSEVAQASACGVWLRQDRSRSN